MTTRKGAPEAVTVAMTSVSCPEVLRKHAQTLIVHRAPASLESERIRRVQSSFSPTFS